MTYCMNERHRERKQTSMGWKRIIVFIVIVLICLLLAACDESTVSYH